MIPCIFIHIDFVRRIQPVLRMIIWTKSYWKAAALQREKKKIEDTGRVIIRFIRNLSRTLSQVKKIQKKSPVSFPQKNVNKEISITFEQMATQRCVRSKIGGIFGCWALLNSCQEYSMYPSCVYMCLNICNPCTIFINSYS